MPLTAAKALAEQVRDEMSRVHPGWATVEITVRGREEEVLLYTLVESDRITTLTPSEIAQSPLFAAPVL